VSNKSHKDNADAARTAAAASDLPSVRERNLRSAAAYDAMAEREERAAAKLKTRQAETAVRRAGGISADDDENDAGGEMDE
jgi:hypothetical protein